MVPPLAPSFTQLAVQHDLGSRRAKPGSAHRLLQEIQQEGVGVSDITQIEAGARGGTDGLPAIRLLCERSSE